MADNLPFDNVNHLLQTSAGNIATNLKLDDTQQFGEALFSFVIDTANLSCQLLDQSVEGKITSTQCSTPTHKAIKIFTGNTLEPVVHPAFQGTVAGVDMPKVEDTLSYVRSVLLP